MKKWLKRFVDSEYEHQINGTTETIGFVNIDRTLNVFNDVFNEIFIECTTSEIGRKLFITKKPFDLQYSSEFASNILLKQTSRRHVPIACLCASDNRNFSKGCLDEFFLQISSLFFSIFLLIQFSHHGCTCTSANIFHSIDGIQFLQSFR